MAAGESLQKNIVSLLWDLRAVWPRGHTSATHWTFKDENEFTPVRFTFYQHDFCLINLS